MQITPKKVNSFMMLKLPLAYIGGVRVKEITDSSAVVKIRHKWMNQNPFRSMFWAAQGMAAEMSTGVLVMNAIAATNKKISMLVTNQSSTFTKKATGLITFTCKEGKIIADAIDKTIKTGEGHTFTLTSEGINEDGTLVSTFQFQWSVKVK